jgi:hypothetical protein
MQTKRRFKHYHFQFKTVEKCFSVFCIVFDGKETDQQTQQQHWQHGHRSAGYKRVLIKQ